MKTCNILKYSKIHILFINTVKYITMQCNTLQHQSPRNALYPAAPAAAPEGGPTNKKKYIYIYLFGRGGVCT